MIIHVHIFIFIHFYFNILEVLKQIRTMSLDCFVIASVWPWHKERIPWHWQYNPLFCFRRIYHLTKSHRFTIFWKNKNQERSNLLMFSLSEPHHRREVIQGLEVKTASAVWARLCWCDLTNTSLPGCRSLLTQIWGHYCPDDQEHSRSLRSPKRL